MNYKVDRFYNKWEINNNWIPSRQKTEVEQKTKRSIEPKVSPRLTEFPQN